MSNDRNEDLIHWKNCMESIKKLDVKRGKLLLELNEIVARQNTLLCQMNYISRKMGKDFKLSEIYPEHKNKEIE